MIHDADDFGQLNFHPSELIQAIRDWLLDPTGLPLVLQGEHGIGRGYCLRAACHNQYLHRLPWTVVSVDLVHQGCHDPRLLADWLANQPEIRKKGLNLPELLAEAFTGLEKGPAAGDVLPLTLVFSIAGTVKVARALLDAYTIPTCAQPDNDPQTAFRRLLTHILAERNLILHLRNADLLDMGMTGLLLDLSDTLDRLALAEKRQGRLLLALACSPEVLPVHLLARGRDQLKVLPVQGLTEAQLRQCIDRNFQPNRLGDDLLAALHLLGRAKKGDRLAAPDAMAGAVKDLQAQGVLIWQEDCWLVNPEASEERINVVLGQPLKVLYDERVKSIPAHLQKDAARFMQLAALCCQWIPQQPLLAYMGLDQETGDDLLDSIEAALVDQEPALLIDEQGRYPGFAGLAVYRFAFPLLAAVLRPREPSQPAGKLLAFLAERLPPNDRATAALCWQLAQLAGPQAQEHWREQLAWFFAPEMAGRFADMLLAKLESGLLKPGDLLSRAGKEVEWQPISFLQAIISACDRWYQAQGGVPGNEEGALFLSLCGSLLGDLGQYQEALEKYQASLAIRKQVLSPDHPHLATSLNNIGFTLDCLGRHEDALEKHQAALAIEQRVLPKDHPYLATILNNIGHALNDLGRHEDALEKHQAALAIRKQVLSPDHPHLAASLNNIGLTLNNLDRHEEALEQHEAALAIRKRVLPNDHPAIASSLSNIGYALNNLDRHEEALEQHQAALAIRQRVLPNDHPYIAASLNNIGGTLNNLDRHEEALEKLEAALAIRQRVLPNDHPAIATSLNNIGGTLNNLDRHEEALERLNGALEIQQRMLQQDHTRTATTLRRLGRVLGNLDQHEAALAKYEAALAMFQRCLPADHPDIAKTIEDLEAYQAKLAKEE